MNPQLELSLFVARKEEPRELIFSLIQLSEQCEMELPHCPTVLWEEGMGSCQQAPEQVWIRKGAAAPPSCPASPFPVSKASMFPLSGTLSQC